MRRPVVTIVAAVVAATALAGCGDLDESTDTPSSQAATTEAETGKDKGAEATEAKAAKKDAPKATTSQQNAVKSAETYLDTTAFSKSGLVEQLKFDGYSKADAKYAANHVDVDWNEQAAKSAETYLDTMGFSRSGLIEQLEFDGYTKEQAKHGADAVGL